MNPLELKAFQPKTIWDEQEIEQVAEKIEAEYQAHSSRYDRFNEQRENAEITGANVRRVSLWVIGSIKTDTYLVDSGASDILAGDFGEDKSFLTGTTDGETKWDCYGEWFTSNNPDRIAELLEDGRVDDAHALLAGRDPETGERASEHYLRACKASLVLYLLGFDRMCLDTRNYRAFKPVIKTTMSWAKPVAHPETELANPYRSASPGQDAKAVRILSHSGDDEWDREKSYWEDKLKWNVPQYHAMTTLLRDVVAERTNVPADLVPQVAFNTEGPTTMHGDLMERL